MQWLKVCLRMKVDCLLNLLRILLNSFTNKITRSLRGVNLLLTLGKSFSWKSYKGSKMLARTEAQVAQQESPSPGKNGEGSHQLCLPHKFFKVWEMTVENLASAGNDPGCGHVIPDQPCQQPFLRYGWVLDLCRPTQTPQVTAQPLEMCLVGARNWVVNFV